MIFEKPGKENTDATLRLALDAAKTQGIDTIVVSSYSGYTAERLVALADGSVDIVAVIGAFGFHNPGEFRMTGAVQQKLRDAGVTLVAGPHALSGVERGLSNKSGGMYPAEIIANTLRMFSQGMKVCVEIGIMALDAGALPYGKPVVAVAGTGVGADTAAVLTPAGAREVLDFKIHEVLCMPY